MRSFSVRLSDDIVPGIRLLGMLEGVILEIELDILIPVLDDELLGLDTDPGAGLDRACDEDVGSDDRAFSDGRLAAEDRGTGVDGDVVLDGGMRLAPLRRCPPRVESAPIVTPW